MADLVFRRPHQRDVAELAVRMRSADLAELRACDHFDTLGVVERGVATSPLCWAVLEGARVLCIFGVAPLRPKLLFEDIGVPWMLATDAAREHARPLVREPAAYIARMLDAFPRLLNFVHADNRRSVRWLQRLGFAIEPAAPFGPNGAMFHPFWMQRHV